MAIAQYFEDFKLGSKRLSDFNGIIYNKGDGHAINVAPSITHMTEKLPNRDGELYYGSTVDPRLIELSVYFEDEVDIEQLSAWLCSKEVQPFSFVDDYKEIDVVYNSIIDMRAFYNSTFQGLMDLTFVAYDPYFRVINEKNVTIKSPTINKDYGVKTKGNVDSYPMIKIVPNGTQSKIRFKINDITVVLQNVSKAIYLDCETEEVYELNAGTKVPVREKFYSTEFYEFPYLKPFSNNTVRILEGTISQIDITLNSRIL